MPRQVSIFDFCETLVTFQTHDCFVRHYLQFRKRWVKVFRWYLLKTLPAKIIFKISGRSPKPYIVGLLNGEAHADVEAFSKLYAKLLIKRTNQNILELMKSAAEKADIFIVSGGLEVYIEDYLEVLNLPFSVNVLSNKLEVRDGVLTGKYCDVDCMASEKVVRLNAACQKFSVMEVYSDCMSDAPLFRIAKNAFLVLPDGEVKSVSLHTK